MVKSEKPEKPEKSNKLGICVTYENGRMKILGDMKPEELAELPISHERFASVNPMQPSGCVMMPASKAKCPPGKFLIEVGLDHRDELKVFDIRPADDPGDRRSRPPGRRSTDRPTEADA